MKERKELRTAFSFRVEGQSQLIPLIEMGKTEEVQETFVGRSTRHKKSRCMCLRGYPLRNTFKVMEPEDMTRESSVRDQKGA